jgi:hypothetical protein
MNAAIKKVEGEIASIANDLKPLLDKSNAGELNDDENTRLNDLVKQFNKAGEALVEAQNQEQELLKVTRDIGKYTDVKAKPGDISRDTLGDPDSDKLHLTPGQRFAQSEQLKRAIKQSGNKPDMRDDPVKIEGVPLLHAGRGWTLPVGQRYGTGRNPGIDCLGHGERIDALAASLPEYLPRAKPRS